MSTPPPSPVPPPAPSPAPSPAIAPAGAAAARRSAPARRLHIADAAAPGTRAALIEAVLQAARGPAAAGVFTALFDDEARAAARAADAAAAAPATAAALHPLAGLPVTVKDLYDIAGRTTMAGSVLRAGAPPALADAPAVARLRATGAALLALTNMSEFAFSGVGINPHHGTPRNPCDAQLARVPGGSSSGAAVSVALGLAVAALGSDTGGSIRIPAALCGLVGFKNTQSRTPRDGAFPLSFTLDTVCAMANSVADCLLVDGVLAGAPLAPPRRRPPGLRLGVPEGSWLLHALDETVARAWQRSLARLRDEGCTLVPLALPELDELAPLQARGSFAAAEAYAVHREALATQRAAFDPRVAHRIAMGQGMSAADYVLLHQARRGWIARVEARLADVDALICPTVPIVAPPLAPLAPAAADDELFFRTNALLLRNPAVFNFLDGCAFSLPMQAAGELPSGLMLAAAAGHDAALAGVALALEPLLAGP